MVLSMEYIKTLTFINFGVLAISLGSGMLLAYRLFKLLEKNHVAYYKSLGKPTIAPIDQLSITTTFNL